MYLGGLEFKDGLAESYNFADGRLIFKGEAVKFQYSIKDHLGNSVVLFEDKNEDGLLTTETATIDNDDLEVLQRNFYYAFGMSMEGEWQAVAATPENRYKYNGKEKLESVGLYGYGARFYDASIGRFTGVDPLADEPEQVDKSPYAYAWNNPIYYTDPDGRCPECAVQALKFVRKAYKVYKKTKKAGEKFTSKHLKDAGLDEIADIAGDLSTVFGSDASLLDRARAAVDLVVGTDFNSKGKKAVSNTVENITGTGKRRRNRIPDKGDSNTVGKNNSGTTAKKYGPDGNVQKEYNKGHGKGAPKNEQNDHIHDYKPNPNNPSGRGDRQSGRKPKKGELIRDFDIKKNE